MLKSEIYKRAQIAVLTAGDWIGGEYTKLEILRVLMGDEDSALYWEREEEKKKAEEEKVAQAV